MKYAVLGTGMVGQALATRLAGLGHDVMMGSRRADSPAAVEWAQRTEGRTGTFADAIAHGEVLIDAVAGDVSIEMLNSADPDHLRGKVLADVANPIDRSSGMPPTLVTANTDSLGEQIQRTFPDLRVVKTLNTMSADIMVDPALVPGSHSVFVSGDDADAKAVVAGMLGEFGWPADDIVDLGGISSARGTEMYLALWLRLWGALGDARFNVAVRRG